MNTDQQFYGLEPSDVMDALEKFDFTPTGRYLQLNSYENRVYELELEIPTHGLPFNKLVTKFYRPNRWSQEALLDELNFLTDLKNNGITVVSPVSLNNNPNHPKEFIGEDGGIYFCVYPKFMGRMPQELSSSELQSIGRTLARIHNIGEQSKAEHRLDFTTDNYGWPALEVLQHRVAPEVWNDYCDASETIFEFLEDEMNIDSFIRIHGDCHKGNLLYDDKKSEHKEFFFVDFDDFCNGPAIQDFWMLLSEEKIGSEFYDILAGYEELRSISHADFKLIPALRALRIIHYSAWIARRWQDPHFPALFPQFNDYNYWASEMEKLRQIAWSL